ncbi:hypothetical protein ACF1AE_34315, partial [Streptomyces sp. NPDC014986]|uniref:hypothetical protein n=1 Tax=Streptomyces sp. NPDC014986 TaxID=3364934 RepID=UPI0037029E9E
MGTSSFGGGFLTGDLVGVAVAAHGHVPGLPGSPVRGGLLPALVGELRPAPLAHRPLRLPLSGTAPLVLRIGAGVLAPV